MSFSAYQAAPTPELSIRDRMAIKKDLSALAQAKNEDIQDQIDRVLGQSPSATSNTNANIQAASPQKLASQRQEEIKKFEALLDEKLARIEKHFSKKLEQLDLGPDQTDHGTMSKQSSARAGGLDRGKV